MSYEARSPIDADPLAAIRSELVAAARRRVLARRRRRRTGSIALATLGLLTVTSGAFALTNTGTGVPSIDRFLSTATKPPGHPAEEALRDHEPASPSVNPAPTPNLEPMAGSASPPLEVSLGAGERALAVGYGTPDGRMCAALASSEIASEPRDGFVGCVSAAVLADALDTYPASTVASGGRDASTVLVQGFATEDVKSVVVVGPAGRVEAALAGAWAPGVWRGDRLRVFFAVIDREVDKGTPSFRPPIGLPLEVRLADGRTLKSEGGPD